MKNIVLFGNCQSTQLRLMLSELLPASEFTVSRCLNNNRQGGRKSNQEIIAAIKECDVLIYQPLSSSHGELSEENIKQITKDGCVRISFPYFFNSGVYSLCHAPRSPVHSYGKIHGEEIIIAQLEAGKSKEEILADYQSNKIDFNLIERFSESLTELKRREASTDIKFSEFIEQNYQDQKLFLTHNHPTNTLFLEIIRQITEIVSLPIDLASFDESDVRNLPETTCPISPHDIETHGYKFDADADWMTRGTPLVEAIINEHLKTLAKV